MRILCLCPKHVFGLRNVESKFCTLQGGVPKRWISVQMAWLPRFLLSGDVFRSVEA